MKVTSKAITDGVIPTEYGCRGEVFVNGMPGLSIPFEIEGAPEGTKSYAVIFDDYDAVPVCGFNWLHWTISDLRKTKVEAGESHNSPDFTEGCNSWHSVASKNTIEQATGYGGPAPPDKEHRYTLKVFALDTVLDLKPGFRLNELFFAMDGHVLAHAKLIGRYAP